MKSVFALCPEGDRHFDTFRLYESLQAGCIPIVVEREGQAARLLGQQFPAPIFETWKDASQFVKQTICRQKTLNLLQQNVQEWWISTKTKISQEITEDLTYQNRIYRYDADIVCGA